LYYEKLNQRAQGEQPIDFRAEGHSDAVSMLSDAPYRLARFRRLLILKKARPRPICAGARRADDPDSLAEPAAIREPPLIIAA
jgi:hypothetical protein